MKRLTPAEKREIIKRLRKKLGTDNLESLGYNRYAINESYKVAVEGGYTIFHKYKMVDEEGNMVFLENEYNGIFAFTRGVAIVCIRKNPQFINTDTGLKATAERKDGLIDINGKELLPCIYDSINVHLDGFTEITKDRQTKTTNINTIINGEFEWE